MASIYFPSALYTKYKISKSPKLISQARFSCDPSKRLQKYTTKTACVNNGDSKVKSPFLNQSLILNNFYPKRKGSLLAPVHAESSGSGEEDRRALDAVLKLYTAIKNRNTHELSDIISDECRCVCNFFSCFQPLHGKKQVLGFFTHLMEWLGQHVEFVVQPTLHDGLNVGVHWKLEWSKTHMPLGKGFSFYILQNYQGRLLVRNVEMFMEPLLHIEPLRLKIMSHLMNVMSIFPRPKGRMKKKASQILLALLFMAVMGLFTIFWLY
ncbi:uncharacterized protein LOC119990159 [Tripterygium wilfordii]|nr:uncharacterized protein LOC119990159 [Tripterygium wilfordii]